MYHAGFYGGRFAPIDEEEIRKASSECECVYVILFVENETEIYNGMTVEERWKKLKHLSRVYGNLILQMTEIDFSIFKGKTESEILEMLEPATFSACNGLVDNIYGNEYKNFGVDIDENMD